MAGGGRTARAGAGEGARLVAAEKEVDRVDAHDAVLGRGGRGIERDDRLGMVVAKAICN